MSEVISIQNLIDDAYETKYGGTRTSDRLTKIMKDWEPDYYTNMLNDKDKITLPRVKWLEEKPQLKSIIKNSDGTISYEYRFRTPSIHEMVERSKLTNNTKHLSLLDRLKRMFKK